MRNRIELIRPYNREAINNTQSTDKLSKLDLAKYHIIGEKVTDALGSLSNSSISNREAYS